MSGSALSTRYAKALIDVIFRPGSPLQATDAAVQLREMEQLIGSSHDLHAVLMTPAISSSRKKAVLGRLGEQQGVSPYVRNFLFVLIDHKRINSLSEIRRAFEELMDEEMGFIRADVTAAEPLDPAQGKAIEAELSRISGKKIIMRTVVDPSLLGGITARVGSTVYDGSIRGQLDGMRRTLQGESLDYKVGI